MVVSSIPILNRGQPVGDAKNLLESEPLDFGLIRPEHIRPHQGTAGIVAPSGQTGVSKPQGQQSIEGGR